MVEVHAELIATIHAEGLLGQTHELIERLIRREDEDQHAIDVPVDKVLNKF